MAGYGNQTAPSPHTSNLDLTDQHTTTRFSRPDSHAYKGGHDTYGSGATGGAGFGNKTAGGLDDGGAVDAGATPNDAHRVRFGSTTETGPYSGHGAREYKSGTVGGAGWGNKTGSFGESNDSTIGKIMEKAGHVMHNEGLVAKGKERRRSSGFVGEGEVGVGK